jgi:hypothetical protein
VRFDEVSNYVRGHVTGSAFYLEFRCHAQESVGSAIAQIWWFLGGAGHRLSDSSRIGALRNEADDGISTRNGTTASSLSRTRSCGVG